MKIIAEEALKMLRLGVSFSQATILSSSGSTPRGAGSCMLIRPDGGSVGTVGGGILEASIQNAAVEVIREKTARIMDFELDGNDAAAAGMICGGRAKVLIDFIDAGNGDNLTFFEQLFDAASVGARSWVATLIPESGTLLPRNQCIILSDGSIAGSDGFDRDAVEKLSARESSYDIFTRLEHWQVYLQPVGTNGTAYVFGAGHCGEKLVHMLHIVGFNTVIIDDREEFANALRFPDADEILVPAVMDRPFDEIRFNMECYIVIVTRGHLHDETVLRRALRTDAGYIGMIGSRSKRETIYDHLRADGFTDADIARIYSPIGLPIGAETPEEIAVSITAEMIQVRAEKKAGQK